ncbi:Tyrosine-protein phosphatase [Paramyrothecium foliicola]|nr:Tyrosine-protein phosphatase [Paramyrothecium foliicola]
MDSDGTTQLEGILNFRDIGKSVNGFLGQRRVREGLLYRSARPDDATARDKNAIRNELCIKSIIDLRTKTEHLKQEDRHRAQVKAGTATGPLRIDGVQYHDIKVTGSPRSKLLTAHPESRKLIALFVFGYRLQAIKIIGQEVMCQRGLIGLGLDTLDQSGPEIRQALMLYASPQSLPALVHCTQGKDRTGLIAALVLMILDVPIPAIEHDYALTDAALVSDRAERIVEIREIGLTDEWADTDKNMIAAVVEHLDVKYGGLDGYLNDIGFDATARSNVRNTLLY